MRIGLAGEGEILLRRDGYRDIYQRRSGTELLISVQGAYEPKVALDDRNCRFGDGTKRRAPAARRIISLQGQRLAMDLQLFLPISGVEIRRGLEPIEECLLLRL
jgi:hypothetical protein